MATSDLTDPAHRLRQVLELERNKKFRNQAVIGGLDPFIERYLQENPFPPSHPFLVIMRQLPTQGYCSLHPIQRRRVVEELLAALEKSPMSVVQKRKPVLDAASRSQSSRSNKPKSRLKRPIGPNSPVIDFAGVNVTNAQRLGRLGVRTASDLLKLYPYRYCDFANVRPIAELVEGQEQTVVATVWAASSTRVGRRKASEAIVGDDTGTLRVIWWGQTHIGRQLAEGKEIALSGRVKTYRGRRQMESPEWELVGTDSVHTGRLVPMYPGTEGLPQRLVRRIAKEAVDTLADQMTDLISKGMRTRQRLMPLPEAIRQIHFPDSREQAEAARRRIAFEELLLIQIGVLKQKQLVRSGGKAPTLQLPKETLNGFVNSLPFKLTDAQRNCISELIEDLSNDLPMNRLLQGDVGSGKTIVATVGLLTSVASGWQGAIMAPTEILAEQHYRTLTSLLAGKGNDLWANIMTVPYLKRPVRVALLTGSKSGKEKEAAQEAIARGETDIAIGTQALIQEDVSFPRLGLVVVDEQHRFGVHQRAALREKADSPPHVLVMTATPIPRTLALTLYGDLDISVMDEMPPGRPPVKTHRLRPEQRKRAYDFTRNQIVEGRQAYIICPLVEESEAIAARSAVQEYKRLSTDIFPDLRIGVLHGRLSPSEKESVMRSFRYGHLDILVSTAVVEVGVDVPNATVMLVEGADRFGLAQLHQFRGRVRRSKLQAYCLLLSESHSPESQERLAIMETVYDGFKLAEEDLRLRGPGEFFGTRQSGLPDLRVAKVTDAHLVAVTRSEATRLLEDDPNLARGEHLELRKAVTGIWEHVTSEAS